MSGKSTGMILLGILAVAGLGLSGFMFFKNEIVSPPTNSGSILVGLWDFVNYNYGYAPHDETNDWLIQPMLGLYNDTRYLAFSNNNTRFTLLRDGYYKVNLNMLVISLIDGQMYNMYLLKNGVRYKTMFCLTAYSVTGGWMSSSVFVHSNGTDYIEINGYHSSDPFGPFYTVYDYQFSIEYML